MGNQERSIGRTGYPHSEKRDRLPTCRYKSMRFSSSILRTAAVAIVLVQVLSLVTANDVLRSNEKELGGGKKSCCRDLVKELKDTLQEKAKALKDTTMKKKLKELAAENEERSSDFWKAKDEGRKADSKRLLYHLTLTDDNIASLDKAIRENQRNIDAASSTKRWLKKNGVNKCKSNDVGSSIDDLAQAVCGAFLQEVDYETTNVEEKIAKLGPVDDSVCKEELQKFIDGVAKCHS